MAKSNNLEIVCPITSYEVDTSVGGISFQDGSGHNIFISYPEYRQLLREQGMEITDEELDNYHLLMIGALPLVDKTDLAIEIDLDAHEDIPVFKYEEQSELSSRFYHTQSILLKKLNMQRVKKLMEQYKQYHHVADLHFLTKCKDAFILFNRWAISNDVPEISDYILAQDLFTQKEWSESQDLYTNNFLDFVSHLAEDRRTEILTLAKHQSLSNGEPVPLKLFRNDNSTGFIQILSKSKYGKKLIEDRLIYRPLPAHYLIDKSIDLERVFARFPRNI